MNTWTRIFAATIALCLSAGSSALAAASGASPDGLYELQAQPLTLRGQTPVLTNLMSFQPFTADIERIKAILARATPENPNLAPGTPSPRQTVELSLPMPNEGEYSRFEIEEVAIMHPALAARYPEIKTYRGRGLDDAGATLALDVTPAGMHAQIRTAAGAIYIDPYYLGNNRIYASYYKSDIVRHRKQDGFYCETPGDIRRLIMPNIKRVAPLTASGTQLRTYRLACAANGEYTATTGGTVASGLAAVVTVINRVSAVYEAEVAVRLVLIANNNTIIYTNAATDPYSNSTAALGQNQTNLDAVIGAANYDIGHVFTTGSGGVAGLGVVCRAGQEARGTTGLPNPIGDAFNVDYVAHEMGHQFGGNHTFNGTGSNCAGGNRSATHAYEPGSGTTIMAYAGICGVNDNLAPNSDAYFIFESLSEIVAYTTTGMGNCPTPVATGNSVPTVSAGSNFTIPSRTPFALTGTASDADGDLLTYCWEERDLGAAQAGNVADNGLSPIFRSFYPTYTPTRTFPKASNLVAGIFTNVAPPHGETLPITNRTLNFRLTARDNRRNGGAINTADMMITVIENGAGFAVTAPSGGTFPNGSSVAAAWNVTNTNIVPVNTANVKISLSTDGGYTYPYVLLASTPNDGSEMVTLPPGVISSSARVKVEAVGNIFFSISPANFAIN
jgi:hypothetical protein